MSAGWALPAALALFGCAADPPPPAADPIYFTDTAAEAGLAFRHFNGFSGQYYYVETFGAGAAFLDYDGDHDLDLYLTNGTYLTGLPPDPLPRNHLYQNQGSGTFRDLDDAGADAVVGGDQEKGDVDGAHSRHHRLDEALVTGHIDDGRVLTQKGETQLYGNPPRLLLRRLVGVSPSEPLDQEGLAVVDVAGGTDDGVTHCLSLFRGKKWTFAEVAPPVTEGPSVRYRRSPTVTMDTAPIRSRDRLCCSRRS